MLAENGIVLLILSINQMKIIFLRLQKNLYLSFE
ncbi:Uncharacterised protein [Mycobacteroides abscessus subsp. abscessus]|nr:Uncharacterised protein [Mycobacteroides abscessus subsp. abscessus]